MGRGGAAIVAVSLLLTASLARANINEWTLSGGSVVKSNTPCPGGVGVNAVPGASLSSLDLTKAYLISANLTGANISSAILITAIASNGTLTNANLNDANFSSGTLTNAILTGATVVNTNFSSSNLTKSQLYSTASYQAMNLGGISLAYNNLNAWNFAGQNLTNSLLRNANLTSGTFAGANLTSADLSDGTLTNANFAGAVVTGAFFTFTNLTAAQLYSTASYQARNLQGISLNQNDLTNWNLAGQNLTNAVLASSELSGVSLTGAIVAGADFGTTDLTSSQLYSTASYQTHNLQGIVLSEDIIPGWNFSNQDLTGALLGNTTLTDGTLAGANLTNASLVGADLTNVNMTGAIVVGADFGSTGLTTSQLYNTASYQARNLPGIGLSGNDLAGGNFVGQNLTNAVFSLATLTNANFSGANMPGALLDSTLLNNANLRNANLQNAIFSLATLNGADFSAADLRGATDFDPTGTTTKNTILPDGTIQGLHLSGSNSLLIVRDYTGSMPIPIHVTGGMTIADSGTLQIVLSGPTWGSTISFDPGITVTFGGILDMAAPGVDPNSLLGQSIPLFDLTGVTASGQFSQVTSHLPSRYTWNTSGLYTSGTIDLTLSTTAAPVAGQWAYNGGGNWSTPANWSGGVIPGAPEDTAVFGSVLTAGTANVSLDMPVNLAGITFGPSGSAGYTISSAYFSGLTLSNTAGPATITSSSGTNEIAAPITLGSNLSVSASTGSILTISGAIVESGSSYRLSLNGVGELVLSGVNNYTGGTFVSGGTMVVTSPDALADGTNLTIGNPTAIPAVVAPASAIAVAPVPEPGTLALLSAVAVVLFGYSRRRQRTGQQTL
jgi:autotransporter-associated beta strand protein